MRAQLVEAVVWPLPFQSLGTLIAIGQGFHAKHRTAAAVDALHIMGHTDVTTAQIERVYAKIEEHFPAWFHVDHLPPTRPYITPCVLSCCGTTTREGREKPVTLYCSRGGIVHGTILERHCPVCNSFFAGPWQYKLQLRPTCTVMHDVKLRDSDLGKATYFAIPASVTCSHFLAMSTTDLRRTSEQRLKWFINKPLLKRENVAKSHKHHSKPKTSRQHI